MTVTFDRDTKRLYNRLWAKAKALGPEHLAKFKADWKAGTVSVTDFAGYEAALDSLAEPKAAAAAAPKPEAPKAAAPPDVPNPVDEVAIIRHLFSDEVAEHFKSDLALLATDTPLPGTDAFRARDAARKRVANRRSKAEAYRAELARQPVGAGA